MASEPQHVAVAGAGRMGRGISLAFAWTGRRVALIDSEERSADDFAALAADTRRELDAELALLADIGALTPAQGAVIARRIAVLPRAGAHTALAAAPFVFEAVTEVLDVKAATYAWLCRHVADDAVLASTTSTMLADTIARLVTRPERYTNAHWLNPAHLIPLVEVSPARATAADTVDAVKTLLETAGKVPVVCRGSPGYIVSRIQALAMNEAARLVEEGVATAEDIDQAIRVGFGPRYATLGLLEFIDWGGGDILYYASRYLAEHIDAQRFAPPRIVEENMRAGRNGLRDGIGFYDYRNRDVAAYRRERLAAFVQLLALRGLMPPVAGDDGEEENRCVQG